MLQKAKTPAGMLAFSGSSIILPNQYCMLGVTFCQEKKWELGGRRNGGGKVKTRSLRKYIRSANNAL
jgi:hypothetical protein